MALTCVLIFYWLNPKTSRFRKIAQQSGGLQNKDFAQNVKIQNLFMMIYSNTSLSNFMMNNCLEKLFLFLFFCQQPRPPVCSVNSEIHSLDQKSDVLLTKVCFRFWIMEVVVLIFWALLSCHDWLDLYLGCFWCSAR